MTEPILVGQPLDVETDDRLFREVKQAMELAKDAGFRVIPEQCDTQEGVFTVGRSRPGDCYEVIAFRGLQAQAIRAEETTLLLLDESEAGTTTWTGYALQVVRDVLGVPHETNTL